MSEIINIHAAKTHLSRLVERAAAGEEIIIARAGKPLARLAPLVSIERQRTPGLLRGHIHIAPDFNEALPEDVLGSFYGEDRPGTAAPTASRTPPGGSRARRKKRAGR